MDPVTAIGLVATCTSIITRVATVVSDLHDLRSKLKNADRTVNFFVVHLTTLRNASTRLSEWIEQNPMGKLSVAEQADLHLSFEACDGLVEMIEMHVLKVKKSHDAIFTFGSRVKFLWNETEIKEYREILHLQVQALMFQLQIIQLPTQTERSMIRESPEASVIDRARDETSSLIEKGEHGSVRSNSSLRTLLSGRESGLFRYIFDETLFSSGPYKKAYAHELKADKKKQAAAERRTAMLQPVAESPLAQVENADADLAGRADKELATMLNYIEDPQAKTRTLELIKLLLNDRGRADSKPKDAGEAPEKSEAVSEFEDYYSPEKKKIIPGSVLAVLWAYEPRAGDEWELERGDMIKVVGVWDDGWATGYKAEGRAENLEEGTIVKVDEDGDIKAFPIVCCTFTENWRKTIEGS